MLAPDRTKKVSAIRVIADKVVLAAWLFTTPAIIIQAVTGIALILYGVAGACWLPVVAMQIQMRNLARDAEHNQLQLPELYSRPSRVWFWPGVPAFTSLLEVFWLMVNKPQI